MRPSELEGLPAAKHESAEVCLWRGIRCRLQVVANVAGDDGLIYINGQTFTPTHFKFLLDNFQCPKPK